MKIELVIDADIEDKITITTKELTPEIQRLYTYLKQQEAANTLSTIIGYQEDLEYYLQTENILFFETIDETVYAHTTKENYIVKSRLYELEKILPQNFMRISKTTILNVTHLYAIEKGFGGPRLIRFLQTKKAIYVSRKYYPLLNEKLKERL